MPFPTYTQPLTARAVDGDVVITGPGRICGSFDPGAMLVSLDTLRSAYADAVEQRRRGLGS